MKKKTHKKQPPSDSTMVIRPGASLAIDADAIRLYETTRGRFLEARGTILATAFDIEFKLDTLLCTIFFPGCDRKAESGPTVPVALTTVQALRALFDTIILKPNSMPVISFDFKIKMLGQLTERLPQIPNCDPKQLLKKLDNFRAIRNKFAHSPLMFEFEGQKPDVTLKAIMVTRDQEIVLDGPFFEAYDATVRDIQSGLDHFLAKLREDYAISDTI